MFLPYLDNLCEEFEIDEEVVDSDELKTMIAEQYGNVANCIAERIFQFVIDRAFNWYGLPSNRFDYFLNGSLDTHLYYRSIQKGTIAINTWKEIVALKDLKENN